MDRVLITSLVHADRQLTFGFGGKTMTSVPTGISEELAEWKRIGCEHASQDLELGRTYDPHFKPAGFLKLHPWYAYAAHAMYTLGYWLTFRAKRREAAPGLLDARATINSLKPTKTIETVAA
jgi:hypothetical protein